LRDCGFLLLQSDGFREQGIGKYLAHFAGPMPYLAPLMVPIELISHMARPLSLTVRLYANMYAGEQVTLVFLSLTYFAVPRFSWVCTCSFLYCRLISLCS